MGIGKVYMRGMECSCRRIGIKGISSMRGKLFIEIRRSLQIIND
jgi:hypothetical protein